MWTCPKCGEKIENQFDSCWKCAGHTEVFTSSPRTRKLTFSLVLSVIIASLLAPLLADCVHSLLVVSRGIRFYQAELGDVATSGFFGYWAGRAFLTFLVLIAAVRFGSHGRVAWCICGFAGCCWTKEVRLFTSDRVAGRFDLSHHTIRLRLASACTAFRRDESARQASSAIGLEMRSGNTPDVVSYKGIRGHRKRLVTSTPTVGLPFFGSGGTRLGYSARGRFLVICEGWTADVQPSCQSGKFIMKRSGTV